MLCAAKMITDTRLDGSEYTTLEVRPYVEGLEIPEWTLVEAEVPTDVILDGNIIRALTPQEKLARLREERIDLLKVAGREAVYTHAPEYKQANMLLGIYPQNDAEAIKHWINTVRLVVGLIESAIWQADSKGALEQINISYKYVYQFAWHCLTAEWQQALLAL